MRDHLDFENRSANSKKKSRSWFPPSPQVRHAGRNPEASDQTRAGRAPTLYQSDAPATDPTGPSPQRPRPRSTISANSPANFSNSMVIAASATIARLSADSPASTIARS